MIHRPKPYFLRKMRQEEPLDSEIEQLKSTYNNGGLKAYEPEVANRLSNIPIEQINYTDPLTKEVLLWVYVGNYWWCRKRKKGKYEFARLVAIKNINSKKLEIYGLWDQRIHETIQKPVTVTKKDDSDVKGYIVGWNAYEVMIEWINKETGLRDLAIPVKDRNLIEFEFFEDEKQFRKVFETVAKNNKRG